jgi:hypothetical protein
MATVRLVGPVAGQRGIHETPGYAALGGRGTRLGHLLPRSGGILEALLFRGELPRGDAAAIVDERQGRSFVSALLDRGVLTCESAYAPLRLIFPAVLASRWMPGLFSQKATEALSLTRQSLRLATR